MSEELKNEEQKEQQETQETANAQVETDTKKEENQETEKELSVEEQLDAAKKEIEELNDKLLRKIAEFDNYRKRTLKERTELILNGGEKVITAILPVIDDMERAIVNGSKTEDPQVLREGMELIYQKFKINYHCMIQKMD